MRILVIEDNVELASIIQSNLQEHGLQADVSNSGLDGEEKAFVCNYDLVLLDLNLPDKDGIEILHFLRQSNVDTPIIIITARDELFERANGLNWGADDYITKPFDLVELRARIHAVLRRFHGKTNPEIVIGKLAVSPIQRTCSYDGVAVDLKNKEFDMLEAIAFLHPQTVPLETIAEHVYGEESEPSSSVLRVHIARLKLALLQAAGYEVIKTIRGKGYQLCEKPIVK